MHTKKSSVCAKPEHKQVSENLLKTDSKILYLDNASLNTLAIVFEGCIWLWLTYETHKQQNIKTVFLYGSHNGHDKRDLHNSIANVISDIQDSDGHAQSAEYLLEASAYAI
jgi:hypothetical protein